jgi:hypothetical protein
VAFIDFINVSESEDEDEAIADVAMEFVGASLLN